MKHISQILGLVLIIHGFPAFAWDFYGNDAGGSKFSQLKAINLSNISNLQEAWVFQTGDAIDGRASSFQATPVYWEGKLYFNTAYGQAFAIDAASGKPVWQFNSGFSSDSRFSESAARGVTLWHGDDDTPECAHRVLFGDLQGQFHALDARTGEYCPSFGDGGRLDLTKGVGEVETGDYTITSPPALIDDTLYIGSAIGDNRKIDSERGIIRAIDVVTGAIKWTWDPVPRDRADPASDSWAGDSAQVSGGANVWAPMSADQERKIIYAPTSAPSPDFFGGHRAGDNHYSNSLVALDAETGRVIWHQQLVHHDVWDYDTPAQPVLTDIDLGEGTVPAVIQATKTGMVYVFDRRDGTPLIPIEERQVPQDGVPGEVLSATQPFSTLPPLVNHRPITTDDAFGIALFDKRACRKRIRSYRSDGIFTPPSLEGTIMSPGYAGGVNWGGLAVDAERGIAIAFVNLLPAVVRLVPVDEFTRETRPEQSMHWQHMRGTPHALQRDVLRSFLGLPCTKPPWGQLVAVDLVNKKIAWRAEIGTTRDLTPAIAPNFEWGLPGMGGALMTASGLAFIGTVAEHKFRALDVATGNVVWEHELPRAGMATPMTYEVDGRQYVTIAAGGHSQITPKTGDYLVTFALPE